MSPRSAGPSDVRERLIQAARVLVEQADVAQVSLRAIARQVGVSHQAASHHFKDRAGLFTALAAEGFVELSDQIDAATSALPGGSTGADRVAATGIAYVRFADARPGLFDAMFRSELLRAADPALLAAQAQAWQNLYDSVATANAQGWGGDTPVQALAVASWSQVHGLATLRRGTTMALVAEGLSVESVVSLVTAAIAGARV